MQVCVKNTVLEGWTISAGNNLCDNNLVHRTSCLFDIGKADMKARRPCNEVAVIIKEKNTIKFFNIPSDQNHYSVFTLNS